uniref:Ig-like domain-containing protein n=1 Tax=Poecilia formosa TaxID=48698 RepID=A0A096MEG5_POEFO
GSDVTQPAVLWKNKSEDATIDCSHKKGELYFQMYWFRQLPGKTMELVVFTTTGSSKHDFGSFSQEKFSATKAKAESGALTVKSLEPADEGLYFCAVGSAQRCRRIKYSNLTVIGEQENAHLFFALRVTAGSDVDQPAMLWRNQGDNATISCKHSKGSSYYQMYWYRQLPGEMMKQIVYTIASSKPDFEAEFKLDEKFSVTKPDAMSGTFTVHKLVPGDQGLYFC